MAESALKKIMQDADRERIECPQCHTHFGVLPSELIGLAIPRFHCSKCDHVFAIDEAARSVEDTMESDVTSASGASIIRLPENAGQRPLPFMLSGDLEWNEDSDDETETIIHRGPVEEAPRPFDDDDGFEAEQVPLNLPPTSTPSSRELSFSDDPIFSDGGNVEHWGGEYIEPEQPTRDLYGTTTEFPGIRPQKSDSVLLMWLGAPVALFLIALFGLSMILRSDNALARGFNDLFFPNVVEVAPPGLFLKDVRLQKVRLADGASGYMINGVINNSTAQTFQEIVVEGVVFDGSANPVLQTKIRVGSDLSKIQVSSLTSEMARELQGSQKKRFELEPDHEERFAMALIDNEFSKARFYTARIYSVR